MLNGVVRKIQARAHDASLRPLAVPQKFFYPVRRNNCNIIIHQYKIVALCMGGAEIIDCRIIELPFPVHHAYSVFSVDALVKRKGFFLCTIIFYNNHFIIPIS